MRQADLKPEDQETIWRFLELKNAVPFAAGLHEPDEERELRALTGSIAEAVEVWMMEDRKRGGRVRGVREIASEGPMRVAKDRSELRPPENDG